MFVFCLDMWFFSESVLEKGDKDVNSELKTVTPADDR